MDTNKNNNTAQVATAGSTGNGASPSSVPMTNTGSKGRSGGSKFKNLLAKLSGGHHGSNKGAKPNAGGSSTARLADEASPSSSAGNVKNKASTNSKMDNFSNKNNSSASDKRASKQAGSSAQRVTGATTSKMTPPNKQDTKGKGTATDTSSQPQQASQGTSSNAATNNSGSLPSIPTPAMYPVDYFGSKGVLPENNQQQQRQQGADLNTLDTPYGNNESDDDDEIDGADADASIRPITPSSIDASSSFTGSTSLHSLAPTSRTFKSFRTGHSKTSASTKPTLLSSGGGGVNGTSILAPSTSAAAGNASNATVHTPAGLGNNGNDTSISPPNSLHSSSNQNRADGASISQSLTLQSHKQKEKEKAIESTIDDSRSTNEPVDMQDPDANRIATSLHSVEGIIMPSSPRSVRSGSSELPPSTTGMTTTTLQPSVAILQAQASSRHGPRASPLRNSFTGQISNLAAAPALTAATEEESDSGSQVGQARTPRDSEWAQSQQQDNEQELDNFRIPEARTQQQQTDSSSITNNNQDHHHAMRSSASITFSKLPPATPSSISSAQLYSAPGSPGRLSSYTRHLNMDRSEDDNDGNSSYTGDRDRNEDGIGASGGEGGIYHYPRYSAPDPSNNPRASSPPPDNASMLTLASSTGGGERAPSVYTAASRYRDGFSGVGNGGGNGGAPSIVDSIAGNRYRNSTANEDASIRAIAPSRRGSTDSIGSKWSAAILSQKESSYQGASHAGANGVPADGGSVTTPDNASFKKRTPSLRTVATTSSYYAAPSIPNTSTELKA